MKTGERLEVAEYHGTSLKWISTFAVKCNNAFICSYIILKNYCKEAKEKLNT